MDVLRLVLHGITPKQIALALVALIIASFINAAQEPSIERLVDESVERKAKEEQGPIGPQ